MGLVDCVSDIDAAETSGFATFMKLHGFLRPKLALFLPLQWHGTRQHRIELQHKDPPSTSQIGEESIAGNAQAGRMLDDCGSVHVGKHTFSRPDSHHRHFSFVHLYRHAVRSCTFRNVHSLLLISSSLSLSPAAAIAALIHYPQMPASR